MSTTAPELEVERLEESIRKYFTPSSPVFEYTDSNGLIELAVTTANPRHQQRFLFHRATGATKQQALEEVLDYIREHRGEEPTYTIQWRAFGDVELHTSYFSAQNIMGALDKFFYGRDLHTITVFSVTLNPLS